MRRDDLLAVIQPLEQQARPLMVPLAVQLKKTADENNNKNSQGSVVKSQESSGRVELKPASLEVAKKAEPERKVAAPTPKKVEAEKEKAESVQKRSEVNNRSQELNANKPKDTEDSVVKSQASSAKVELKYVKSSCSEAVKFTFSDAAKPSSSKAVKPSSSEAVKSSYLPLGRLPPSCTSLEAEICYLESPASFFLCPSTCSELFLEVMGDTQEPGEGEVSLQEGSPCLALGEGGLYYRALVTRSLLGSAKVTVFLVDHGQTLTVPKEELRPLGCRLEEPGLVVRAGMAGVGPVGEQWVEEELEAARMLLGVGDCVPLRVEVVGEREGVVQVRLTDYEANDLAETMIDAGFGKIVSMEEKSLPAAPPLTYEKLSSGILMVFEATSPADIYFTSDAIFTVFLDTVHPAVQAASLTAAVASHVVEGSLVLAHDGEAWYRAQVRRLLPGDKAELFLLDNPGSLHTLEVSGLRTGDTEVFLLPVTAVPAVISGWEDEDRAGVKEEWGARLRQLVEELPEASVEVEVVSCCPATGRTSVRVPSWEDKLVRKGSSNAAKMLMKMKAKAK